MAELPMRDITDPTLLRAMAHPVRLKLLNSLVVHGPSTATELAERIADTPANCSWHLRQLAKFGLIEEATDLPSRGRNRPWRWVPMGSRWGNADDPPEMVLAGREAANAMLGFEVAEHHAWEERKEAEPAEWRNAAFATQTIEWLTPEELQAIDDAVRALYLAHPERITDPTARPANARPVRLIAWGVPAR